MDFFCVIIFKFFTFETQFGNPSVINFNQSAVNSMKKFLIPAVIIAAAFLLYEQSKETPNIYLSVLSIVVFMFLLFKLNTRIPHKNNDAKNSDDVQ